MAWGLDVPVSCSQHVAELLGPLATVPPAFTLSPRSSGLQCTADVSWTESKRAQRWGVVVEIPQGATRRRSCRSGVERGALVGGRQTV